MPVRNWKRFRANNLRDAMRACKDFALEKRQLSVARIAELMGDVTEDSLYGWLSKGSMPTRLIPTFEMVCGAHFVSEWLAASAGRMVIAMPKGSKANQAELMQITTDCSTAMEKLAAFYADPSKVDTAELLELLQRHLEQVAFQHHNVGQYIAPQLEFEA
ncbi:hypothetical protein [Comamonas fluminis]|uniref:hypothetical protein n=1 Tax=Comamonas fluminis TaxID=2796366 RepID=UPI001C486E7D|nr:hypothetical protein [Comamonas fluminis]